MFDQLMNFLTGKDTARQVPDLAMCVAMLMLEAAHRDDHFGEEERAAIRAQLGRHFALDGAACDALMAKAEERQRDLTQLQPYTHEILERMEPAERVQVIEMLWEVVYADGVLHPDEDALVRKVAGLLYVEDHVRIEARQRVAARLKAKG